MAETVLPVPLDELEDENQMILNDLEFSQKKIGLLENYRKILTEFSAKCVCNQNKPLIHSFESLETQYKQLFNDNKSIKISETTIVKSEDTDNEDILEDHSLRESTKLRQNIDNEEEVKFEDNIRKLINKLDQNFNEFESPKLKKQKFSTCDEIIDFEGIDNEVIILEDNNRGKCAQTMDASFSNCSKSLTTVPSVVSNNKLVSIRVVPQNQCSPLTIHLKPTNGKPDQLSNLPKVKPFFSGPLEFVPKSFSNPSFVSNIPIVDNNLIPEMSSVSPQVTNPSKQLLKNINLSKSYVDHLNLLISGSITSFKCAEENILVYLYKEVKENGLKMFKLMFRCIECWAETKEVNEIVFHINRVHIQKGVRILMEDLIKLLYSENCVKTPYTYDPHLSVIQRKLRDPETGQNELGPILGYKCNYPDCDFIRDSDHQFDDHCPTHNWKGIVFKCDFCGLFCPSTEFLSKHIGVAHTNHSTEVPNSNVIDNSQPSLKASSKPPLSPFVPTIPNLTNYLTGVESSATSELIPSNQTPNKSIETKIGKIHRRDLLLNGSIHSYASKKSRYCQAFLKSDSKEEVPQVVYVCVECRQEFSNKKDIMLHITIHCNDTESLSLLKRGAITSFNHKKHNMRVYLQKETKESDEEVSPKMIYRCNECWKELGEKRQMLSHINRIHVRNGIRNPIGYLKAIGDCNDCTLTPDQVIPRLFAIQRELESPDTGHKELGPILGYKCTFPDCHFVRLKQNDFVDHFRKHNWGPFFDCQLCPQSFINNDFLVEHIGDSHTKNTNLVERIDDSHTNAKNPVKGIGDSHERTTNLFNLIGDSHKKTANLVKRIGDSHTKTSNLVKRIDDSHKNAKNPAKGIGDSHKKTTNLVKRIGDSHPKTRKLIIIDKYKQRERESDEETVSVIDELDDYTDLEKRQLLREGTIDSYTMATNSMCQVFMKRDVLFSGEFIDKIMFKCTECGKESPRANSIVQHTFRMHKRGLAQISIKQLREFIESGDCVITVDENNPMCSVIRKHFINQENGTTGLTPNLGYKCNYRDCKFVCILSETITQHLWSHEKEKIFECDICGEKFVSEHHLSEHENTVHNSSNDRLFECESDGCDYQTFSPQLFKQHSVLHQTEGPFKCTEIGCYETFEEQSSLTIHIKEVHPYHRPYRCHWAGCVKAFKSKEFLKSHLANHSNTNQVMFECDLCGKQIRSRKALSGHKIVAHNINNKPMHKCPHCPFKTVSKYKFRIHSDSHKVGRIFRCEEKDCNKMFKCRKIMINHKNLVHSDVRPFACDWPGCDFRFKAKPHMERHLKNTHLNDNIRFPCEYCDTTYKYKGDLSRHIKRDHSTDSTPNQK